MFDLGMGHDFQICEYWKNISLNDFATAWKKM